MEIIWNLEDIDDNLEQENGAENVTDFTENFEDLKSNSFISFTVNCKQIRNKDRR